MTAMEQIRAAARQGLTLRETEGLLARRMTQAERREFVDDFFLLLTSSGARTLTEFFAPGSSAFLTLFRQSRRIPAIHSFVSEVAKIAMREYAGDVAEDMAEDVRELRKKLLRREES